MKRVIWGQLGLLPVAVMVATYAYGVLQGMRLDVVLLRVVITGGATFFLLLILQAWLEPFFRPGVADRQRRARVEREGKGAD